MKHEFGEALVEKDVRGEATLNDELVLKSNPELWRMHLVNLKRKVESTIVEKKAESMSRGIGFNHLADFQDWKRGAVRFKRGVEEKLSQLKISQGNNQPMAPILEDILYELRYIADLLETKNSEKQDNKPANAPPIST